MSDGLFQVARRARDTFEGWNMPHLEILLVDDDPLIRHVIADELEEAGHFVTSVVGPEAALEVLSETVNFDLVLIDYTMPGMTGSELVTQIRALEPDMRLAILTGHSELPEPPPCPVLTKGVRMAELIKAIEALAVGKPASMSHDATATRVDLLVDQIATKPAVGGVRTAIGATYEPPPEDTMPDAFASLLERLPGK
jgi:CheY-like chemotaxis protein